MLVAGPATLLGVLALNHYSTPSDEESGPREAKSTQPETQAKTEPAKETPEPSSSSEKAKPEDVIPLDDDEFEDF